MLRSQLRVAAVLVCASLILWGCPNEGVQRFIPPGPTVPPPTPAPGDAQVFIYVTEATDQTLGTLGGAVSAYQLGEDGFLVGDPIDTVPVVNPRRVIVHPALDVLYVASPTQVIAFDISGGTLLSLCPGSSGLAPPCATNGVPDGSFFDLAIAQNDEGGYVLYVAEGGNAAVPSNQTRISAYPLGENGELPGFPTSQGTSDFAVQFQAVALSPQALYASDTGASLVYLFELSSDGNLPYPAPTPSPINQPTPEPTDTPDPPPTPTPSPITFQVRFPGRMSQVPLPEPTNGNVATLYIVEQARGRMASYPLFSVGDVDFLGDRSSESRDVGFYNAMFVEPDGTRLYGVAYQVGRVDTYEIDPDGTIIESTLTHTFEDAAAYPTGLAFASYTIDGVTQRTMFVSKGGLNRVDAYTVMADGTLDTHPFTTSQPRNGTFPSDVAANVIP